MFQRLNSIQNRKGMKILPPVPTLLQTGLVYWVDTSGGSYPGTGTLVKDLVTNSNNTTLSGSYTYVSATKTIQINNTSTTSSSNVSQMQLTGKATITGGYKTVSIWYKQLNVNDIWANLFDSRLTAGNFNGIMISRQPSSTNGGTYLGGITNLYIDGGNSINITSLQGNSNPGAWTGREFTIGTWHNITVTTTQTFSPMTITVANRGAGGEGYNTEIAIVLVYSQQITEAQNRTNYNYYRNLYPYLKNGGV